LGRKTIIVRELSYQCYILIQAHLQHSWGSFPKHWCSAVLWKGHRWNGHQSRRDSRRKPVLSCLK